MRVCALLACAALAACGPSLETGPHVNFDLIVSRGLADTLSAFQVSLVTQGGTLDCLEVQNSCVVNQVDPSRFVPVQDSAGTTHRALQFPLKLVAGTPNTQDVSLKGITPGRDFAVVVEALSQDVPPRLAGSACNYVKEITAGANATVQAEIVELMPTVACDPRVEK